MNKKRGLLIVVVLLVAASAGYFWFQQQSKATPESALVLYGNIDLREVDLAFDTTEHVADVLVEEGDQVTEGQLLAKLETQKLQASAAAATAMVQAAQQSLAKLKAGNRPQEIRAAKAQADALAARARIAQISYQRLRKLLPQQLAAQEDVDQAKATSDAAEAEARAARETYLLSVAGAREEDIAQAEAELAARQAELTLAQQRLDDAELRAPRQGIVRDRILEPGDIASPQAPALTLALTEPLWVRVYVPGPDLGRVRPGMRAQIETDSFPGKQYDGWVGYISPTAEFTPKNVETPDLRTRLVYQARVFLCDPSQELRLGMPATVRLDVDAEATDDGKPDGESTPCRQVANDAG